MISIIYSIVIFPLEQIIELFFLFIYRISHHPGISLFGVSFAITLLTLPLYNKAEEWQIKERNIQRKMSPKIKKIKEVFKGDEQYMILSAYYRQNNYHPVYSLRSTFSLLIQVPFFIAAWSFISGLEMLNGHSFIGIADLGAPDRLLQFRTIHINLLPIIMTMVNIISSMIYTKGFAIKEKLQLYIMASLFLVLLYNSPSGLVLYWTFNNIFSLIRNAIQRFRISVQKLFFILLPLVVLFDIYVLFIHPGALLKKLLIVSISITIILVYIFYKKLFNILKLFKDKHLLETNGRSSHNIKFILSVSILFLLSGLVIPSALVMSSPEEFSFIESYKSPFPFIFNVSLQSLGFFVFWPVCLYLFFSNRVKKYFAFIFSIFAITAIINTFIVFENYGYLTNLLIFSEPKSSMSNIAAVIINIILLCLTFAFFLFTYKRLIFKSIQFIAIFVLLVLGIVYIFGINSAYNNLAEIKNKEIGYSGKVEPFFTLSKEGKNVMLIMLDMAMPGYIPEIFNEKPELLPAFSGFTWYPNCISFGSHTFIGAPPIYGGYEYTPVEINRRNKTPLTEKHDEAYLLLPYLFSNSSWSVSINDHPGNISLFGKHTNIKAENITEKLGPVWIDSHNNVSLFSISNRLNTFLIRFCFFKMSPLIFRDFLYDKSYWLSTRSAAIGALTNSSINNYAFLDYLPELTSVTSENQNFLLEIYGFLTHDDIFLQAPDYIPSISVTNKGNSKFSREYKYHVNMSAFLLLAKYFNYLNENGVYDNTRIIIVSDHGKDINSNYTGNIQLPNGQHLQGYHALLMFKDFYKHNDSDIINKRGGYNIANDFMSNADACLFTVQDLIDNPVNPFTNQPLATQKDKGLLITTLRNLSKHNKYEYNINPNQWLHVRDNIFIESNWSAGK
jgi:YidC/Oxa1 family membrane protein insertase